jgi:hypothetical protein
MYGTKSQFRDENHADIGNKKPGVSVRLRDTPIKQIDRNFTGVIQWGLAGL